MIRALLALLLAALFSVPAHADDNRPLVVTVNPAAEGSGLTVQWKIPANIDARFIPDLAAPQGCIAGERQRDWSDALGTWREQEWQCDGALEGRTIAIDYSVANPNLATIARVRTGQQDGVTTIVLQPGETALVVPTQREAAEAGGFFAFLKLGFEHIWEGFDHLLFVTGLIIVARGWKRILVTITGFTIAHSLTLGLAALDVIRLSQRAVEAVIALSIVFLAVEIVKGPRDTLTWRRPVVVAAAFGLLHGFGFANVLREVGLPEGNLLGALFAFNIGIEIGQVIFAGLVFALLLLADRVRPSAAQAQSTRALAGYALGIIASSWLFERILVA